MAQAPYVPRAQEARNKAVVERYFREVLDGGNVELLREIMARDAVLHRPGFDVTGLEAAMQRLRAVLGDHESFSSELSGLMAEGDLVAVRVHHRVRLRAGATLRSRVGDIVARESLPLEWTASVQFRLENGRIVEEWVTRDELGMLLQLGKVTLGD